VNELLARRWLLAGVVVVAVVLALVAPAFVLGGAPVLVLVLVLAVGWFPGEDAIAGLRDRRARHRRTRATVRVIARPRAVPRASRLLICFSLANRPPPLLLQA
jgi:4-hydroxybenzoate polyprenyltransferase